MASLCAHPRRFGSRGLTLVELIIAMAIMAVLAAVVIPMAETMVRRTKEIELRRTLREIRTAIDAYKSDYDRAVEEKKIIPTLNDPGYPESLEALTEGRDWGGLYPYKRRYLRSVPRDPFDSDERGWRLRAYEDDPDSTVWGGGNVYDVHSQNDGLALDGTRYDTW